MPNRITETLQSQIRTFFHSLSEDDPQVLRIIAETLIALEKTSRAWHFELHNGSFTVCTIQPCRDHNRTLNKIYADIIDLRRNRAE